MFLTTQLIQKNTYLLANCIGRELGVLQSVTCKLPLTHPSSKACLLLINEVEIVGFGRLVVIKRDWMKSSEQMSLQPPTIPICWSVIQDHHMPNVL